MSRPRAFTLLELLLSMALLIVLMGMMWNILSLFTRSQTHGLKKAEQSQLVRSLSQLLEDDLRSAIQDPIHPFQKQTSWDDDIRRFGLSGSEHFLRFDVLEENEFDLNNSGLKTLFYEFTAQTGLLRQELDFETAEGQQPANPNPEASLSAPEVIDCNFRYYNGNVWSDSWDSIQRQGLPVAVEVSLKIIPLSEVQSYRNGSGEHSAETAIRIVAFLPASPIQKFDTFQRKTPAKKKEEFTVNVPPPIPMPALPTLPQPAPPPMLPPTEQTPKEPQQSWIRGK
jgi:type II secretory pathway component PulJ